MSLEQDYAKIKSKFLDKNISSLQKSFDPSISQINVSIANYKKLPKSFEFFKSYMTEHMNSDRLDRHKISVAMALAVLNCRIFKEVDELCCDMENGQAYPKRLFLANEILALDTGLDILRSFMLKTISVDYNIPIHTLLMKGIVWQFPDTLRDKNDNYSNLVNIFFYIHHHSKNNSEYNSWMLCHIFYYIEMHNRELIISDIEKGKYSDLADKVYR